MNIKMFLCAVVVFSGYFTGYSQHLKWIKFNWVGDSVGNRYMDKIAIDIPVQLDNLPYRFTMQLDLGASSSVIYGESIAPYLEVNKKLESKIDTSLKTWIDSKRYPTFNNISLKLDSVVFDSVHLGYYKDYGDRITLDSAKTNTVKEIGTIGFDFFKDKVLVIDYLDQRICVTDAIPDIYAGKSSFINCKFVDGVIMIPFEIGDKTEYLMFDTGSSIFSLITNEENAEKVSGNDSQVIDSIGVSSWGKTVTFYEKKMNTEIKLGNTVIPMSIVYYQKASWDYFFVSHHIWGITGNVFFLNDIVILDFKNQRFGIAENSSVK